MFDRCNSFTNAQGESVCEMIFPLVEFRSQFDDFHFFFSTSIVFHSTKFLLLFSHELIQFVNEKQKQKIKQKMDAPNWSCSASFFGTRISMMVLTFSLVGLPVEWPAKLGSPFVRSSSLYINVSVSFVLRLNGRPSMPATRPEPTSW